MTTRVAAGSFFFNTGDQTRPFRRLLSFTSTSTMSNSRGNSRRNMAGSVSHWSMTMGVRRLDHHRLFVRGTRVCDQVCRSCSCRCMQEENADRFLPRLSARLATRDVYHGLLRHYSRSASLVVRLCSRCEVRPTSVTRGRAIPRCILICYSAAWARLYSFPANLRLALRVVNERFMFNVISERSA